MTGLLFIISGPSGVGKNSLVKKMTSCANPFVRVITHTTRQPRKGEVNGVDYHFIDVDSFVRYTDMGFFIEFATVHGNMYGTSMEEIESKLNMGLDLVIVSDVQGAAKLKSLFENAIRVFVAPPSLAELEKRLKERNSESSSDFNTRLLDARYELNQRDRYDYLIVNDSIKKAFAEISCIRVAEQQRPHRNPLTFL